ncbi:hypothetical protein K2O51_31895 (plasmid) [Cupriavidus pinatubonensis]|uniref:hypothetical protein n=1 Tax=Cupriavidus pinatubonensis TaxID=248026 RepID=UPI001C736007|nr:hypothetical protein [Cupriavidus pinatubonensis]QYY33630.1 hypothetical protein K2O51_31895 [Cupriavidus pinatubonensis]
MSQRKAEAPRDEKNLSRIQRLLRDYRTNEKLYRPLTKQEVAQRIGDLPYRAALENAEHRTYMEEYETLGLQRLTTQTVLYMLGLSPNQNLTFQKSEEPVEAEEAEKANKAEAATIEMEMLLYCYEAKPRHMSLALQGWHMDDFIAYIYRDFLLLAGVASTLAESTMHAKEYLRAASRPTLDDTAGRIRVGIATRLTSLFGRHQTSFYRMMKPGSGLREQRNLIAKLLEPDDDAGYTWGRLAHYKQVREDLYELARFCWEVRGVDIDEKAFPPEDPAFLELRPVRRSSTVKPRPRTTTTNPNKTTIKRAA